MANQIVLAESQATDSRVPGKLLLLVRRIWFVLVAFLFITFLISVPGTYQMLRLACVETDPECGSWVNISTGVVDLLAKYHISLDGFAIINVTAFVIVSLFCWVSGLIILRTRSYTWHGLLASYLLISLAAGGSSFVFVMGQEFTQLPDIWKELAGLAVLPMYLSFSLFFQTFPNGRIYPRWAHLGTLLILANYWVWMTPTSSNLEFWTPLLVYLWLALVYGFHIFLQGYRYRYYYSSKQRQQTKWLIFGYAIALTITITLAIFINPPYGELLEGVTTAFGFYFPIAAGMTIAILRYNLWDIDVIINRTLVYSVLTALLVAIYALIVSLLSLLIQDEGNFVVSLVGAGTIAVTFQPLRNFVQRAINRWLFGQRNEPLAVMIEFGKSLEMIASPEDALSYLVETTARSLKLPYIAIENEEANLVAVSGKEIAQCEQFPLIYQAENIGTLLVSPRSSGEVLSAGDRLLLENVARQVSNIVHAARLTQDLQQSRQEILTTREEERRRLRRDLHDGLGPALATLTLQAEAAREWLATKPEKSDALLQEIIMGSQSTLADIRRIVYALRPPALDDLGLVPAIREQATRYTKNDLSITVEAPEQLPPIPAAVEVATYRIIQEALTNVARHSKARTCTVCLRINGKMDIEVIDDGVGIPSQKRAGVGLNSIHERAAELGGSCVIQSKPGQGTQVLVSLPGA